jgi:hypothetical protein
MSGNLAHEPFRARQHEALPALRPNSLSKGPGAIRIATDGTVCGRVRIRISPARVETAPECLLTPTEPVSKLVMRARVTPCFGGRAGDFVLRLFVLRGAAAQQSKPSGHQQHRHHDALLTRRPHCEHLRGRVQQCVRQPTGPSNLLVLYVSTTALRTVRQPLRTACHPRETAPVEELEVLLVGVVQTLGVRHRLPPLRRSRREAPARSCARGWSRLDGTKTIESRFGQRRSVPYERVTAGDIMLLKAASGPVVGIARIAKAAYFDLRTEPLAKIRKRFSKAIAADDDFWEWCKDASYATLLEVEEVRRLAPIACPKRDRRGWVVLPRA